MKGGNEATKLNDDERIVRDWLRDRGYPQPEHEPAAVTRGRKPDFLAIADGDATPNILWAEVKSLLPERTVIAISKSWPILKQLPVPEKVNGFAMLWVNETTREQSVRALGKMFCRHAIKNSSENVRLIFIQHCPTKTDVRLVEVQSQIVEKVWARGAGDGKIAVPSGTVVDSQAAVTWEQDGKSQTQPAFKVFDWQLPFNCAVVARIDPTGRPLTSISPMSGGRASLSARVLSALEDANSQLRNACRFKSAPGVVFIMPGEDHADDGMIATAAYGRLTVPFSRESNQLGEAFYGRDGAFRPNKNTHISAAIRLRRRGGIPMYFPNPFAREPIDERASLFSGLNRAAVKFE